MNNIHEVDAVLNGLLQRLKPVQLRRAMRQVAKFLRSSNRKRITSQRNAAGEKFKKRKNTKDKRKMLTGFKKNIKASSSEKGAEVGIYGNAARLAGVHDRGELEGGVKYAERQLIGLSASDVRQVEKILSEFIL